MAQKYTEEQKDAIIDEILSLIRKGKSLATACKECDKNDTTIDRWIEETPERIGRYTRARECRADFLVEESLQIADDGSNDTYKDEDGNTRVDKDAIQRSRLRVETRKWFASKLYNRKYGDKVQTEHIGELKLVSAKDLSDDELAAIISK